MTSSIGGSSIARSSTGNVASNPAATSAVWSTSTRTLSDSPSCSMTSTPSPSTGTARLSCSRIHAVLRVTPGQRRKVAVEPQLTPVDDDHPLRQGGHIAHVVAGQQHRRPVAAVVVSQEAAQRRLRGHVEAEGGLVEEQHTRTMEQSPSQFTAHSLPQAEHADLPVQQRGQVEEVDELVEHLPIARLGDPIDRLVDHEGVQAGRSQNNELRWPITSDSCSRNAGDRSDGV